MKRVAVWKINSRKPSKFTDGDVQRIILKGLDDNKSYYLNLDTSRKDIMKKWSPYIQIGRVIDVTLQSRNPSNVLPWGQFIPKENLKEDK